MARKQTQPKHTPGWRIAYLPVCQKWVLLWHDTIIDVDGVRSFSSKRAIIDALNAVGIGVNKDGTVYVINSEAEQYA